MNKPEYWYKQSAVVPYLIKNGKIKIVLITSLKKKRWIIPKGIIEENLTPGDSAAKEAFEEAGISGKISTQSIGQYEYKKWGGTCQVEVFLMNVEKILDDWPEAANRDRKIIHPEKAQSFIKEKALKKILNGIEHFINKANL